MVTRHSSRTPLWAAVLIGAAVCGALLWVRYVWELPLLFHTLAEMFAITVAIATFMVTWNARRYITSGYLLILGISYFFVAGIDLFHTVAYKGMGLIPGATVDLPTQLWLAGHYLQAAALLIAPFFIKRKPNHWLVFLGFGAGAAALLASIALGVFPVAFGPDGLTSFKIGSEYVISIAMLIALVLLYEQRQRFEHSVWLLLSASIVIGIAAEISFTVYTDPFGLPNTIGHILRVIMYYLVYRAIVEASLKGPYDVLFRELTETTQALSESEERFRSTFEQATLGIGHVGLDGRYTFVNKRLCEMTGYTAEELLDKVPETLTHPSDAYTERGLVERLELGDIPEYRLEKRIVRKDGSSLWVNAARTAVRNSDGEPAYFVEIVEDISDRKTLQEKQSRAKTLSEALNTIDRLVLSTMDAEKMLGQAMKEASIVLYSDMSAVVVKVDEGWKVVSALNSPEGAPGMIVPVAPGGPLDRALHLGEVVVITDTRAVTGAARSTLEHFGVSAYMSVPLVTRDGQYGALLFTYKDIREFTAEEVDFARKLAALLTVATQNADLYNAERRIADTLQAGLLKMPPHMPGLELAYAYRSATKLARIGGDFYDIFEIRPGLVFFVLGDVSGKGLEAATVTAMAKSTIRAFAYQEVSPAAVLDRANHAIIEQVSEGRFITAVIGSLDLATGDVAIASAGHPAPILCGKGTCSDGDLHRNPPLGLFEDLEYQEIDLHMEPGDTMVLFSDGLLDARSGSDLFGEEGVYDVLAEIGGGTPKEIVDSLLDRAKNHAQGEPADDIAIVAIRYVGV